MDKRTILAALYTDRRQLDVAITALETFDQAAPGASKPIAVPSAKGKRKVSLEARARMAKAQKARWADKKKGQSRKKSNVSNIAETHAA